MKTKTETKLAYLVTDDEHQNIIFSSEAEIEEIIESEEWEDYKRSPEYDVYAEQGYVPALLLIVNNWYLRCGHCETVVDIACENLFYLNKFVFCCEDHLRIFIEEEMALSQSRERIKNYLLSIYPELTNFWINPCLSGMEANFKFPGSQFRAAWYSDRPNLITVNQLDKESAIEYFPIGKNLII